MDIHTRRHAIEIYALCLCFIHRVFNSPSGPLLSLWFSPLSLPLVLTSLSLPLVFSLSGPHLSLPPSSPLLSFWSSPFSPSLCMVLFSFSGPYHSLTLSGPHLSHSLRSCLYLSLLFSLLFLPPVLPLSLSLSYTQQVEDVYTKNETRRMYNENALFRKLAL